MERCKSKVFKEDIVNNKLRYKTANTQYQLFYTETNQGFQPCLLTGRELATGIKRASKNKEDLKPMEHYKPKISFWSWLTGKY